MKKTTKKPPTKKNTTVKNNTPKKKRHKEYLVCISVGKPFGVREVVTSFDTYEEAAAFVKSEEDKAPPWLPRSWFYVIKTKYGENAVDSNVRFVAISVFKTSYDDYKPKDGYFFKEKIEIKPLGVFKTKREAKKRYPDTYIMAIRLDDR